MAINILDSPAAASPAVFVNEVILQLAAIGIDCNHGPRIAGGFVKKGALFNIGGKWALADTDTAITGGTRSPFIKFVVSGSTVVASYVLAATFRVEASWDGAYQGFYDGSENLYVVADGYTVSDDEVENTTVGLWTYRDVSGTSFTLSVKATWILPVAGMIKIPFSIGGSDEKTLYINGIEQTGHVAGDEYLLSSGDMIQVANKQQQGQDIIFQILAASGPHLIGP